MLLTEQVIQTISLKKKIFFSLNNRYLIPEECFICHQIGQEAQELQTKGYSARRITSIGPDRDNMKNLTQNS